MCEREGVCVRERLSEGEECWFIAEGMGQQLDFFVESAIVGSAR